MYEGVPARNHFRYERGQSSSRPVRERWLTQCPQLPIWRESVLRLPPYELADVFVETGVKQREAKVEAANAAAGLGANPLVFAKD